MLNVPPATNNANQPILRKEVEAAVKSLKRGKSAGVDNIPAELLQQGGEAMVNALLINLQQDPADTGMAYTVDPVSSHLPPKERQLTAMLELPHHQSYQQRKQSHAEDHSKSSETRGREVSHIVSLFNIAFGVCCI